MALVVLVVIGGVAAIGAMWWWQYRTQRKRRAGLFTVANQLGLRFSIDDPDGTVGLPFALFTKGKKRGVENVMWGTRDGVPIRLFDYWYYEERSDGKGTTRTYYRYTCAVLTVAADCPALRIGRENILTRLGSSLGFKDVELEYDDFNRAFRVHCEDQRFAFSILDGRMMEWLLELHSLEALEIVGPYVLFIAPKLEPNSWPVLCEVIEQFHVLVPRVVWTTWPRTAGGNAT
jgi:Protein of unknown function (DUF3137)